MLDPEAAIQASLFQQFLVLLVLSPVAAAMSLAAYSVDRREAGAHARAAARHADHHVRAAARQDPRRVSCRRWRSRSSASRCTSRWRRSSRGPASFSALLTPRAARRAVPDGADGVAHGAARSPCACRRASTTPAAPSSSPCWSCCRSPGCSIAQITVGFVVTMPIILLITGVLAAVNAGLMRLGVSLFDRETILTRWK